MPTPVPMVVLTAVTASARVLVSTAVHEPKTPTPVPIEPRAAVNAPEGVLVPATVHAPVTLPRVVSVAAPTVVTLPVVVM
uniref:hypothetical protein n=1 Tax=Rhodococcus sp. 05-2221-1B TaxID=2022498 RepID=UPI001C3C2040